MPRVSRFVASTAIFAATGLFIACAARGASPTPAVSATGLKVARTVPRGVTGLPLPSTRGERTNYRETSLHADVMTFVDSLVTMGAPITTRELARSPMGKLVPLVIASRPRVNSPLDARRLGRPIVYVQANARGSDFEGTEATLALLRDLSLSSAPNVLDSVVVIVVPMYKTNAAGVDLTSDYVQAEAPETRGSLIAFNGWEPDVFIDLAATDNSPRGVALTYGSSLHPAAPLARYTADSLLPEIGRRLQARHKFEAAPRGAGAGRADANESVTKLVPPDVASDHKLRFATNYSGVRGRIGMLGRTASRDPLSRRVATTRAFVHEALSLVAERRTEIRTHIEAGVAAATFTAGNTRAVAIRGRLVTNRFESAQSRAPTLEGYLLDGSWVNAARLLRAHGVTVTPLERPMSASLQIFDIDSVMSSASSVEGRTETAVTGSWRPLNRTVPAGTLFVRMATPRDLLAMLLLEPESDDGLLTWNVFDGALTHGKEAPVVRLTAPLRLYSPGKSASTR